MTTINKRAAHLYTQKIQELLKQNNLNSLRTALCVYLLTLGKGYIHYGYTSPVAFFQEQFGIGRRRFFYMKKVGKIVPKMLKYCSTELLKEVNFQKFYIVADEIEKTNDPEKIKELIHQSATLSQMDLKKLTRPETHLELSFRGTFRSITPQKTQIVIGQCVFPIDVSAETIAKVFAGKQVKVYVELLERTEK